MREFRAILRTACGAERVEMIPSEECFVGSRWDRALIYPQELNAYSRRKFSVPRRTFECVRIVTAGGEKIAFFEEVR